MVYAVLMRIMMSVCAVTTARRICRAGAWETLSRRAMSRPTYRVSMGLAEATVFWTWKLAWSRMTVPTPLPMGEPIGVWV